MTTCHSLFYNHKFRANLVWFNFWQIISGYLGGCGHTDEISQWMERVQNSAIEEEDLPPFVPKKDNPKPAQMPQQVKHFLRLVKLILTNMN